jgi:hypothetical protein
MACEHSYLSQLYGRKNKTSARKIIAFGFEHGKLAVTELARTQFFPM